MTIKNLLLRLRIPAGVMTWRYFSNKEDPIILHHKNALLYVPKDKSKLLHWGFAILQQLAWWSYFGWRAFFNTWRKKNSQIKLSKLVLLLDLSYLTFAYTIPPPYYFLFQLYHYPKSEWLNFIYEHEAAKWQQSISEKIDKESKKYINSKCYFAQKAKEHNIPVVPTIKFIKQGSILKIEDVFHKKSYFLKPDNANQSRGCFALLYLSKEDRYVLKPEMSNTIYYRPAEILSIINQELLTFNYIKQPYVENHPLMTKISNTTRLTTIRIITLYHKGKVTPISAVLEVPDLQKRKKYRIIRIDIQRGTISHRSIHQHIRPIDNLEVAWFKTIQSKSIPYWTEIIKILEKSHKLCPSYGTLGWDIAVSNLRKPIIIIEGNSGWSVKVHQADSYSLQKKNPLVNIIHKKLKERKGVHKIKAK